MFRHVLLRTLSNRHFASNKTKEVTLVKKFTQADLDKFSQLTGDYNPIHSTVTPLSERFVHGAFLNAVVAGIIGTQLPGSGCIVLEQKFTFPKPCKIDVDAKFKVRLLQERKISIVAYECLQEDEVVFQGEAKLMLNRDKTK